MEVNIVSRKFITPSSTQTPPINNHPPAYKLSFFDQLAPEVHMPLLFFYPCDDNVGMPKTDEKIQQLEKSLSETLSLFYPQAGRFLKDDLLVDCNDQGVEFLKAKVKVKLMEFLDHDQRRPKNLEHLNQFVPWDIGDASLATTPMVAIQVTVFECGGLVICVYDSHIIDDGFAGTTFIHAWATASRLGIDKVICPNFDLPSLFPSRDISAVIKYSAPKAGGSKILTRRFVFDAATITTLKTKAMANSGGSATDRPPSRVEAVISTLWKALINAARAYHQGKLRPSIMCLTISLQGRTAQPIPENSCGNFYLLSPAEFTAEQSKMELNQLVGLTRESVRNTLKNFTKLSNADEIFSTVADLLNRARKAGMNEKVDVQYFASLCGFPIYETDFGWGKPCWVTNVCMPWEIVTLFDTNCGTGVEAWVCLNEPYMIELEKDLEIATLINPSPN